MTSQQELLQELLQQRVRLMLSLGRTSRVVEFEDRRIEHFSPAELLEAILGIDQQIAGISGHQESRLFTVASSSG